MTDKEIIKAIKLCGVVGDCSQCPYCNNNRPVANCLSIMTKDTLDLINRQKAEIKRLKNRVFCKVTIDEEKLRSIVNEKVQEYELDIKAIQAEAIKAFAERLKTKKFKYRTFGEFVYVLGEFIYVDEIDNLVKEMVGEE